MDYKKYAGNLLKELVSIPSESGNEEAVSIFIENILKSEIKMDTIRPSVGGGSFNVIGKAQIHPDFGRKLILGGHIDTVPPSSEWKTDPYNLINDGGKLRGLGAGDMKGGIAAQITALKMLTDSNIKLGSNIEFIGLADEERLSLGAHWYKEYSANQNIEDSDRFCILAEPHFNNIVIGANGKVLYKISITGLTGHASNPELGINAIDLASEFIATVNEKYSFLYRCGNAGSHCFLRMDSDYKGYSLNIPDHCLMLLNKQFLANEDISDFENDLRQIFLQNIKKGQIRITRDIPCYGSYKLNEHEPHLKSLITFLSLNYNIDSELRINKGVSDANVIYNDMRVPTVLFGPQGVDFHSAQEYLEEKSFFKYIEIIFNYIKTEYGA